MVGKRIQIEDELWQALEALARDRSASFQELADEALTDLLKKHGRPTDLREALRSSTETGKAGKGRRGPLRADSANR